MAGTTGYHLITRCGPVLSATGRQQKTTQRGSSGARAAAREGVSKARTVYRERGGSGGQDLGKNRKLE